MLAARIFHRINRTALDQDLARIGVRRGDVLLALVSLRSLGYVVGGAGSVVESLAQAVGPEGLLMTPCFAALDPLPTIPPDGIFDEAETPSAAGRVTEAFRKREGTSRSLHPAGSLAACGRRAEEILDGHERHPAAFGAGTPLDRLVASGGRVLAAGTHLGPLLMYLQDLAGFPSLYLPSKREAVVRTRRGASFRVAIRVFRSSSCQVVILQGERPETRDYVLMRDYALVFPPDRKKWLLSGGYLRHNAGRLLGRLERLRQRGVVTIGRIGRAPAALIDLRPFCQQVGADLRWEVSRFKDEYDPEKLSTLGLD